MCKYLPPLFVFTSMLRSNPFTDREAALCRSQGGHVEAPQPLSPTISSVSSITSSQTVSSATVSSEGSVSASSAVPTTLVDVFESGRQSPDTASLSEMLTALSLSPTLSSIRGTESIAERPPGHHNILPGDIPFPTPDGEGKTYEIGVHTMNAWSVPCF